MSAKRLALAALLAVAACGGDDAPFADAPPADAPVDADASAPADAPTDAPADSDVDVDAPVIDAPQIDAPAIDAPTIDAPTIDAPPIDAPTIDAPTPIDAPTIDAPPIDAAPGVLPYLAIEPTPIDFGLVAIPVTLERDVTIRNLGGQSTGVLLSTSNSVLVIASNDCVTLDPGQSCTAHLSMHVTSTGTTTHQLRAFPTNGGNVALADVTARGGHRLDLTLIGTGTTVTVSPHGVACTASCSTVLPPGPITVTSTPATEHEHRELRSIPSSTCTNPTAPACSFNLTGTVTLTITTVRRGVLTIQQTGPGFQRLSYFSASAGSVSGSCTQMSCAVDMPVGQPATVEVNSAFPVVAIASTTWSGPCTGTGLCNFILTGPTTVDAYSTVVPPELWSRPLPQGTAVTHIAGIPGGGLLTALRVPGNGFAFRFAQYAADGSLVASSTEDPTAGSDVAQRIAIDPSSATGGFYAVVSSSGTRTLRRYASMGVLAWAMPLPGSAQIAADAAGNVYVVDTSLRSYTPAGGLRWTVAATASEIAVGGNTVALGGSTIAAYDLGGTFQWSHALSAMHFGVDSLVVTSAGVAYATTSNWDSQVVTLRADAGGLFSIAATPPDHGGGSLALDGDQPVLLYVDDQSNTHIQGHVHTGNLRFARHAFDGDGIMYVVGEARLTNPSLVVIVAGQ